MNENTNSSPVSETDDWDDIDLSGIADDADASLDEPHADEEPAAPETAEADQPTVETEAKPADAEPTPDAEPVADQYTLKHLDEVRTVGRDEVITLAQKGMDYDRLKEKLDEKESRDAAAYAFLDELAKAQNMTVEDLMDSTKASVLVKQDGIDYNAALQRVRLERREAAVQARELKLQQQQTQRTQEQEADARRQKDIADFRAAYPDVDGKAIPKEVWADVAKGMTLLNAYAKHDNARIRAELEAAKQSAENAAKSTGSRADSGKTKQDPFDALWYDGT